MRDNFAIHCFYADGGLPDSGSRRISDLSPKWLAICDDLLAAHGPVLKHNMGSTLSHFDIAMAGPMIELNAYGQPGFVLAITLGTGSQQDQATVLKFREDWSRLVESAGKKIHPAGVIVLNQATREQSILILDLCPSLEEDQKLALLQFGEHLAGAYLRYCEQQREV